VEGRPRGVVTVRRALGVVVGSAVLWATTCGQVLQTPRGSSPVAWETPGRLLVAGPADPDDPVGLWRCRTRDGRCEQAGRPLRHAILPATFAF